MSSWEKICAVVPLKDTSAAKQRLAGVLSAAQRQQLALAMFEQVMATLARVRELAGVRVVTVDPAGAAIAGRHGAQVSVAHASDGHTAAVAAAARQLAAEGFGLLALPADIPLLEPEDIRQLIAAHRGPRAFTIVPARDRRGSNAVICTPAAAVPLRFGDDSFLPHLAAARACGIEPLVVQLPRIALDIDTPDDLAQLLEARSVTRAHALLRQWDVQPRASIAP
jgi:2-phospho-L-lactate/phosphoenolpyruvate guanylyltransferase